jgi:hypothetical protein
MTIKEFCDRHKPCREGREWALANCETMDQVWAKAKPEWTLWVATRPGVLTDRELRLFAVWSARQVQHLMTDPRSVAALDVAERHANGEATDEELAAARAAAGAAWAAAGEAAGAAWKAARAAAWEAAWEAAWAAARAPAGAAQSNWLRASTSPRWEVTA